MLNECANGNLVILFNENVLAMTPDYELNGHVPSCYLLQVEVSPGLGCGRTFFSGV